MLKQIESSTSEVDVFSYLKQILIIVLMITVWTLFLNGCSGFDNIREMDGTEKKKDAITVMAFNIRFGCGVKNWGNSSSYFFKTCEKNLNKIAEAIKSADPDIVGLQEVGRGQAPKLAKILNMNYTFNTHNTSGYGSWWGNAILSKQIILDSTQTSIGGIANRNRSIISARIKINGHDTTVISVHTHHKLYSSRSVRKIMKYVDTVPDPVILIGDFNMRPHDSRWEEIKELRQGFERTQKQPRVSDRIFVDTVEEAKSNSQNEVKVSETFPRLGRIDYVLVEKKFFDVHEARLVTEKHRKASDHYAYFSIISPKWN